MEFCAFKAKGSKYITEKIFSFIQLKFLGYGSHPYFITLTNEK